MHLLDLTLSSAAENLALDEALLLDAEGGRSGEVLRFWEWQELAVVLGSGVVARDEIDEEACAAAGVPILRRSSGGGTVLLGDGCLCYSLVLSMESRPSLSAIRPSYEYILTRIVEGLGREITIAGISDLASDGRKFSGNAQQRKRTHLLHHGTILYAFDLSLVSRFLREPARQPEYRAGREHGDFVCNLSCSVDELRRRMRESWEANEPLMDWPREEVKRICARRYGIE